MADDKESWEEPTKREPRERAVAVADLMRFYRNLSEVQLECGRLCVALERRDTLGIEFAASRLAAAWLVATETLGLVEVPQLESLQRNVARLALQMSHEVVARLFGLACRLNEVPGSSSELHHLLLRLGGELGIPVTGGKSGSERAVEITSEVVNEQSVKT